MRHDDSARVGIEVRHDEKAPRPKDRVGLWRGGTVRRFDDDRGRHPCCVALGQLALDRRRNQHVALELEHGSRVVVSRGAGKACDTAVRTNVVTDRVLVETVWVGDRGTAVRQPNDLRAQLSTEFRRPVGHVPCPLKRDPFTIQPSRQPQVGHVVFLAARLAECVEDASPRRLLAALNPTLRHRLSGHEAQRVNLIASKRLIGVGDPRHLAGACPQIGCGDVDRGAQEILLDQLVGIAAGDTLQLLLAVTGSINLDRPLGAPEWHVDDGALVGHERGQRHDFVFVDRWAVSNAALDRQLVVAVLGAPSPHNVDSTVGMANGKIEAIEAVTPFDVAEKIRRIVARGGGLIEVPSNVGPEASFCHRPSRDSHISYSFNRRR